LEFASVLSEKLELTYLGSGDVPEEEDPKNDDEVCGVRKGKEGSGAGGVAGGAQEGEEEEEELWSDDDDERAEDTADASTVATTLGVARVPDGFEIVEQCPLPDVAGRTELNNLVVQKILNAFDDEHYGWYIGTIAGTNLGARDLKQTPRANCVVSPRSQDTLDGPGRPRVYHIHFFG
jgi:hypothetical protein